MFDEQDGCGSSCCISDDITEASFAALALLAASLAVGAVPTGFEAAIVV